MPLNSVQLYTKSIINGIVPPLLPNAPVQAYIAPPVPGDMGASPQAYVWGGTFRERRQTAPRGQAFKRVDYQLDVWVIHAEDPSDPNADQMFPTTVDAIMKALRETSPMPLDITDPTTGEISQVLMIGEDFEVEYAPVRSLADNRYVQYAVRIGVNVYEAIVENEE